MEALLNTFLTQSNQNIDLTITLKGKTEHGKTYLTVLVSEGVLKKPCNDIKITAEIDNRTFPRTSWTSSFPTLNEHAPIGTGESINGLLI